MAFWSRFITVFVLFAALQAGLAAPPCRKHKPGDLTPDVPPKDNTTIPEAPILVVPPKDNTTTPEVPTTPDTPDTPDTSPKDNTTTPDTTPSEDINAYLEAHNTFRSQYDADPLVWNATLAEAAQKWAANCVWEHTQGSPFGR